MHAITNSLTPINDNAQFLIYTEIYTIKFQLFIYLLKSILFNFKNKINSI